MRRLIGLAALFVAAGCAHEAPTASTAAAADFTGSWGGAISRTPADTETIFLSLTQRPLPLLPPGKGAQEWPTGTWSAVWQMSGIVTGTDCEPVQAGTFAVGKLETVGP
jgi:hypothetical protein